MNIHPTAIIDPAARLGREVTVGPFTVIEGQVEIGDQCVIGPHVAVLKHTRLGAGCRLHAGAVVGDLPQDLAFKEEDSYVVVGDRCVIREGVTIHRGTKPGTTTTVGNECFLMANSHVAHNCVLGDNVILANGVLLAGYVEVGSRVFIGGNTAVHQFCKIGRLAMIGGESAVSKDVPPFFMLGTVDYNVIRGINTVGLRRSGLSPEDRLAIRSAFKTLYHSGLNVPQAVERLRKEFTTGPVLEICDFIAASKRGICKGSRDTADEA